MATYRRSLISAGSISLDSTLKKADNIQYCILYIVSIWGKKNLKHFASKYEHFLYFVLNFNIETNDKW